MAEVQIVFANGKHPGETAGHTSRDRVSFATRRGSCRLRSNLKPHQRIFDHYVLDLPTAELYG